MADETKTKPKEERKKSSKRPFIKNFEHKKRLPPRPVGGDNVVYITRKTNFKAQLDKCSSMLSGGEKEIILHGLGAAITRCCNLALQLEKNFAGICKLEVNTGTVDLIDDLEPLTDEQEFISQLRQTSSVHIRVFRTAVLGAHNPSPS